MLASVFSREAGLSFLLYNLYFQLYFRHLFQVTKLTLENSNLMSQFECFLTAINKKEKLCKKLVAKVCDLEVINEKLFQSISQSVNENSENGDEEFNRACTEKMKDLLANALVEQEERLVRPVLSDHQGFILD